MLNLKNYIKKIFHRTSIFDAFTLKKGKKKSFARYKLTGHEKYNSVVGWTPYIKGHTNLIIYNFFSINYSIRNPIDVNIYLVENNEIISEKKMQIYPENILDLNIDKIFNNEKGQIIIVEFISEKIKKNHGGSDGHLRFWAKYLDKENNTTSTVHSMPLSSNDLFLKKDNFSRNYSIKNDHKYKLRNYDSSGSLNYKEEKTEKAYYGFNILLDDENNPLSTWHLSPLNNNNQKKKMFQGFYSPDVKNIDPLIILDPNETGITKNTISIYIYKNKKIQLKKELEISGLFKEKVTNIFEEKITGPYSLFISFFANAPSHSHVHYMIDDKICDQVHMHNCNWNPVNDDLIPIESVKKNNCRKFFHFDLSNKNTENLITIHSEKITNLEYANLKLRIIQNDNEFVKKIKIYPDEPIKVINLNKFFNEIEQDKCIVQLESYDHNFHASGLIINKDNEYIATDHFTGG